MLEFSHKSTNIFYSEPVNSIKSMRSNVPKMKLEKDKYILKSAKLSTEVSCTLTDLLIYEIFEFRIRC